MKILNNYGNVDIYEKDKEATLHLKKFFLNKPTIKIIDNVDNINFYDLILLADVIEHFENDKSLVEFLSRHLKPNGKLQNRGIMYIEKTFADLFNTKTAFFVSKPFKTLVKLTFLTDTITSFRSAYSARFRAILIPFFSISFFEFRIPAVSETITGYPSRLR